MAHSTEKIWGFQQISDIVAWHKRDLCNLTSFDMGRKSSEKRKRRLAEKVEKAPAKHKPEPQPEPREPKPPRKIPKQKIFGGLLAAILLTLLVYIGLQLFITAFRATPLAKLLPDKETVAFVEMNTNLDHTQLVKAKQLLGSTSYSTDSLLQKIEERLSINIENDVKPWLGRQIGLAELKYNRPAETERLASVYFLETSSKEQAEKFLETMAANSLSEIEKTEKEGFPIYLFVLRTPGDDRSLDTDICATFIEDYLVLTPGDDEGLRILIDAQNQNMERVADNEKYQQAVGEAPVNKVAFVYFNFIHEPDLLLQKYGILTGSGLLNSAIQPFAQLFDSEGLSLIAEDNYFVVESFMNLGENFLSGNKYVTHKGDYKADLTEYIPDDVDIFWGGVDAERQVKRIIALLSEGDDSTNQIFEGALESYTEKYFGDKVSLEDDIYPLIQNEFALGVSHPPELSSDSSPNYLLVLDLSDPAEDALRIQKIANNFISSGAVFEPHVEEHELPDGTIAKEIVATPEELIKSETKYDDATIYQMETSSGGWGVYYAILDSKAVISTNKDLLTKSLDLASNKANKAVNSIKASPIFGIHIAPAISDFDEVAYFNILKYWPDSPLIKSLSTGKEYFSDGVKAHYYIYVE